MFQDWETLSTRFILKLRHSIGRNRRVGAITGDIDRWRQPLDMPKLHCIAVRCSKFVWTHGYLGAFSEESFEHFQKVSGNIGASKAHNKCSGAQICDDMQYAWVTASPILLQDCHAAEKRRGTTSTAKKKFKFTPYECSSEDSARELD